RMTCMAPARACVGMCLQFDAAVPATSRAKVPIVPRVGGQSQVRLALATFSSLRGEEGEGAFYGPLSWWRGLVEDEVGLIVLDQCDADAIRRSAQDVAGEADTEEKIGVESMPFEALTDVPFGQVHGRWADVFGMVFEPGFALLEILDQGADPG